MAANIRQRVTRLEKKLDKIALLSCNCKKYTFVVAGKEEEFEAEMNRRCPAHGFRRLHRLIVMDIDVDESQRSKLDAVIERYKHRFHEAEKARSKQEIARRDALIDARQKH